MFKCLRWILFAFALCFVFPAFAQEASAPASQIVINDPTGGVLAAVPGGIYIYGLFVMVAGLVSIFVKDSSMPGLLAKLVNFLAMNGGKAKNDPSKN